MICPDRSKVHIGHERPPISEDMLREASAKRGLSITTPHRTRLVAPCKRKVGDSLLAAIDVAWTKEHGLINTIWRDLTTVLEDRHSLTARTLELRRERKCLSQCGLVSLLSMSDLLRIPPTASL